MTIYSLPIIFLFVPLFIVATFISFYLPGRLLLRKINLTLFQNIVLSTILGMVLWGWQGFIFGFLHIRWMTYIYLLVVFIFWYQTDDKNKIFIFLRNIRKFGKPKFDIIIVLLITIGTLLQLSSTFLNGIQLSKGLLFCCAVPDSLYHIALTNQLIMSVPPNEPGAAGLIVHNYHYLGNLISADLTRIFHLPLIATQFQYLTVLLSLFIGLTAVVLGQLLHLKKSYIRWLVFFLYFSGDLTFLLTLFSGAGLNFNYPTLENALWLWISPPRVFALVVFMASLSIFILWTKRPKALLGIILAFIFSSLIGLKIYFGVFMAVGVTALVIYYLLMRKFQMLWPLFLTGILSLIIYLPVNSNAGGLIFLGHPWLFENFIAMQPAISLQHVEQARLIYLAHNNWPHVILIELLYAGAYFTFVFGTISLGLLQSKRSLSLFPKELNIFLIPGLLASLILGAFFFQQTGGGNSSQFLITFDILASIYTALACYYWIGRIKGALKYIVIVLIIFLTFPRVLYIGYQDIVNMFTGVGLIVDNGQLQALNYLRTQTPRDSVVLVDNLPRPTSTPQRKKQPSVYTKPVHTLPDTRTWIGDNSYYISFLANKLLFLDGIIVQSHGGAIANRASIQTTIINDKNQKQTQQLLRENHISYIYLTSNSHLAEKPPHFLPVVFKNSTITILKAKN